MLYTMPAYYKATTKNSKGSYNHTQDIKKKTLLCEEIYPSVDCSIEKNENQRVYAKAVFIKKNIKH